MANASLKALADNLLEIATIIKFIKEAAAEKEKDKDEDHGTAQPSPSLPSLPLSQRKTVKRKAEDGEGEKDKAGEAGGSEEQPPPPPPPPPPKKKKKSSGKKKSGSKKNTKAAASSPQPRETPAPGPSVSAVTVSGVTSLGDGTTINGAPQQRAPQLAEMDDGHEDHPNMPSFGDVLNAAAGQGVNINEEDEMFLNNIM